MAKSLKQALWIVFLSAFVLSACRTGFDTSFISGLGDTPHEPSLISTTQVPDVYLDSGVLKPEVGVTFQEFRATRPGSTPQRIWFYLPDPLLEGALPLVIVPPAGDRLFAASVLGHRSQPEHFPYARAGYAVVAFSVEGEPDPSIPNFEGKGPSSKALLEASGRYRNGEGGVNSGRAALNFALSRLNIDRNRIFAAGHSSAGKIVLMMAATDTRIRAVAAYAPVVDVLGYLKPRVVDLLERKPSGYRPFLKWSSPTSHLSDITVPTLLFYTRDDAATSFSETEQFAEALSKTNPNVKFIAMDNGHHYKAMIRHGIPAGLEWFGDVGKR
mgnify:CR=1 FL=1